MKKVLVADDESTLRMLIVDSIEDMDLEIDEARDGIESLEKIQSTEYDLIILDYMMPGMTGVEVLEQLSREKKDRAVILMLTAKAQERDKELAKKAGVDHFMTKPFSPMKLMDFVEEVCRDEE